MHRHIEKGELTPSSQELRLKDFENEDMAFQRLLPQLLRDRPGKFVAVRNGKIIDEDTDQIGLARRLQREHRDEFVLVRQVTSKTGGEDYLESPEGES